MVEKDDELRYCNRCKIPFYMRDKVKHYSGKYSVCPNCETIHTYKCPIYEPNYKIDNSKQKYKCPKGHVINRHTKNKCPILDCNEQSWKIDEVMVCNKCNCDFKSDGTENQKCPDLYCGQQVLEAGRKYGNSGKRKYPEKNFENDPNFR